MTGSQIRESFLRFFEERGHRRVRSSSLIPAKDPTLLFTNAGMVQFKDVFLGAERRDYVRATTSQKCVRAGGKHNDLENVGRTARHHTFFEMLGNFSFGDYFKEQAIPFAWEYLTRVAGLPVDRLWVTVYKDDDEAARIWEKAVGVARGRIVRLGEKDNFWAMGDTGPCGPCSEIIIDQGPAVGCGRPDCAVGCDCDRYLELWNLVFMQFNRDAAGEMTPLPKPSIDTGMGLERLAAVLQGKRSNFEGDLFAPLIRFVEDLSGKRCGAAEATDVSIRVIADHLRAAAFLISDGVIPGNEGRGYVLRRIMRRAGRHAWMLGVRGPALSKGVPVLAAAMGAAYPELAEHADYAVKMMAQEEERFRATLEAGLALLAEVTDDLRRRKEKVIPGEAVFRLYDTYGFPLDLAEDMAKDENLALDMDGFERLMAGQRAKARAAWAGSGEEGMKEAWRAAMAKLPPVVFTGYASEVEEAEVLSVITADGEAKEAGPGTPVEVVLDRTPFYGESGGQVGDTGVIAADGVRVAVHNAKKPGERFIVHLGKVTEGTLRVGDRVEAAVDDGRRRGVSANHTATHLLQAALRRVLGDHVKQAGSLVAPDRLRFDFTHFAPVTPAEIARVEDLVNGEIRRNAAVVKESMDLDDALKSGAMAIFGEKYGEAVRVVTVGGFSSELCGGIHVERTGDIGLFKVVAESSVAAGVRRVEAVTGEGAMAEVREGERVVKELSAILKTGRDGLPERVRKLAEELRESQRLLEKTKSAEASSKAGDILSGRETIGGLDVLVARADGLDMKSLREMTDRFKEQGMAVVVLASVNGDNLYLVAGAAGQALPRVDAGKFVGELAKAAGGKGGGRPDFGQAGARDPGKADQIIREARRKLQNLLV